ncbi:MAG: NUDIX domain-containing protein [Clostridia bacterium]
MNYELLEKQMRSLLGDDDVPVTVLSNAAALLWEALSDINWVGFYIYKSGRLHLGPFQGKPACANIEPDKGVCGAAFSQRKTLTVANVHDFAGHIACDSASNSEIVVPLHDSYGALIGVLDIDSPLVGRFNQQDAAGLEIIEQVIAARLSNFMRPIRNSVKAIIIRDHKLLANKCMDKRTGRVFYGLPGGGQEKYETFVDTLQRECMEELGIEVKVGELVLVREYIGRLHEEFSYKHMDVHQMEYMFSCDLIGEVNLSRACNMDREQTDYEWLPLSNLKEYQLYPLTLRDRLLPDGGIIGPVYMGAVN